MAKAIPKPIQKEQIKGKDVPVERRRENIINGGMNGGLYYFYLLLRHEQAERRIRCRD
jgi:hypothetical protein